MGSRIMRRALEARGFAPRRFGAHGAHHAGWGKRRGSKHAWFAARGVKYRARAPRVPFCQVRARRGARAPATNQLREVRARALARTRVARPAHRRTALRERDARRRGRASDWNRRSAPARSPGRSRQREDLDDERSHDRGNRDRPKPPPLDLSALDCRFRRRHRCARPPRWASRLQRERIEPSSSATQKLGLARRDQAHRFVEKQTFRMRLARTPRRRSRPRP